MIDVRLAVDTDGNNLIPESEYTLDQLLASTTALVWIDIDRDDLDEREPYADRIALHRLALEDARSVRQRPIFNRYGTSFFLVMYELITNGENTIQAYPISFFVGSNYVVTARDIERSTLDDVAHRWKDFARDVRNPNSGFLLFTILDAIVDAYFPILDGFGERLEDLEDRVEAGQSDGIQREIHSLRKELFNLRRVLSPEREVLNEMIRRDTPLVNDETMNYFHDVYDHMLRVLDWLDAYREMAGTLFEMQLAIASHRLDRVMRTLTVASIMLMASSLIAGIYGMNFHHMPELAWYFGYPMAIGLMIIVDSLLYLHFRRRGWV